MSEQPPTGEQLTEEELRAAYEAEVKRIRVEDVVVEAIVSMLNLGGRRAGLVPGTESERDLEQVRIAIEGTRGLLPLVQDALGRDAVSLRDALAQLQMAYARLRTAEGAGATGGDEPEGGGPGVPGGGQGEPGGGAGGPGGEPPQPEPEAPRPGEPGPAQRSGRLWVPGQ